MIPYFEQPMVAIGPFEIYAYGVTAVSAVILACAIILRRGTRHGIETETSFRFFFTMLVCALAGSQVIAVFGRHPEALLSDPLPVFRFPREVNTFGAMAGGLLGAIGWCRANRLTLREMLRRIDIVAFAIPHAWLIGRFGCALAHDHRGDLTSSWLAVQFPEAPRYDVGLIEFLFLGLVVLLFRLLDRKPRMDGFYFGLYGILYGAFRIALIHFDHVNDKRVSGLLMIAFGFAGWMAAARFWRRSTLEARVSA